MSARRHAATECDSSNQRRQNSNLTRVEEYPHHQQQQQQAHCQGGSLVAPLRAQLALEYRLQSLCQRLLESYKDQQDWAAVGQVAQSLVTNTQRVSLLKERLLSGNYFQFDASRQLQSMTERPCEDSDRRALLSRICEAGECGGGAEEAVDTGTESGSESSSVGKAFQEIPSPSLLPYQREERAPDDRALAESSGTGTSGASSAVDYETASQQTSTSSEAEQETSTTGLDSLEARSKTGSEPSLIQLPSSVGTTPSPEHSSSSIGCVTPPPDGPQELPPLVMDSPALSGTDSGAGQLGGPGPEPPEEGEGTPGEEGDSSSGESVMETVKPKEAGEAADVGSGGLEVADTNYVEMHLGTRTKEGEVMEGGEGEGEGLDQPHGDSSDSGSGEDGPLFPAPELSGGRSHSSSCPLDSDLPKDQSTPKSTSKHTDCLTPPPPRQMSLSGSDSKLHVNYSDSHHHLLFHSDHETSDDSPRGGLAVAMENSPPGNLDLSLPVSSLINHKRQASIPNFVSRQTRGLRKSTRKLVKRVGSITIRRGARGSLDTVGETLPVTIPSPIRGQDWDPTCLLEELYRDYHRVTRSSTLDNARHSGYMEKLPVAQTKKTLLKGYKRRYFRAIEGNLYYYEDRLSERALGFVKLEDCKLVLIPEKLRLSLMQSNGTTLVLRAPNHVELSDWHRALNLESIHPTTVISGSTMEENPVIIMDIGACSVRVGLAGENAYPELFFPTISSVDTTTGECNDCGLAALLPENRIGAKLVYPRRGTLQMSRNSMAANQAIVDIVDTVLNHYDLQAYQCGLLMTVPPTTPEQERAELAEALMGAVFQFQSILFQEQALLSLYSYNTTTGLVVDIGDHIDIVPVIDGYAIEAGIHRLPFGGNAITEYLTKLLTAKGIRYFSETETYINRFIKEDACFVSLDYVKDCETCEARPAVYSHQINVDRFQLPDHRKAIVVDDARFKATEGLFTPGLWGKDVTGLHDLVWKAIQACPIDQRKLLLRNIYLSGGTSLLPGLQERLKAEIAALAPSGNTVEVHASDNRRHAAFLGAAVLGGLSSFSESVITQDEWSSKGPEALSKWCS